MAFSEADKCQLDASITTTRTEAEDRMLYPWIQLACETLIVIDTVSLDEGFADAIQWFAESITSLQANGVPLVMVTRLLAKTLENAQRMREYDISYPEHDAHEGMLSYKEPTHILEEKARLLRWTREEQSTAGIKWMRGLEMARSAGMLKGVGGNDNGKSKSEFSPVNKTPGTQANYGGKKNGTEPYDMDKGAWRRLHGTNTVAGVKTELCWFFSNAPKGCTRKTCDFEHALPSKYNGKRFQELDAQEQTRIISTSK